MHYSSSRTEVGTSRKSTVLYCTIRAMNSKSGRPEKVLYYSVLYYFGSRPKGTWDGADCIKTNSFLGVRCVAGIPTVLFGQTKSKSWRQKEDATIRYCTIRAAEVEVWPARIRYCKCPRVRRGGKSSRGGSRFSGILKFAARREKPEIQ